VNYDKIFNDLFIANLLLSVMVKNFEGRLGVGKVTAKNQVAPFFRTRCIRPQTHRIVRNYFAEAITVIAKILEIMANELASDCLRVCVTVNRM